MTIKPGKSLISIGEEHSRAVLMHPAQQEMANTIAQLITWLRACETLGTLLRVPRPPFLVTKTKLKERHQTVLARRQAPQAPTNPPRSMSLFPRRAATLDRTSDPWQLETVRLRAPDPPTQDGRRRLCLDSALATTGVIILALSPERLARPNLIREGWSALRVGRHPGTLEDHEEHFALHHDLTNCLRIADLTEFTADGKRLFHEIKAKPHTEKKQLERATGGG